MSNNSNNSGDGIDLTALSFGPAWAKDEAPKKDYSKFEQKDYQSQNKGKKGDRFNARGRNQGQNQGNRRNSNGNGKRRDGNFKPRERNRPPQVASPEGFTGEIMPIEEGLDRLAKQIMQTARTYSVFDLARMVLQSRERFNVGLKAPKGVKIFRNVTTSATFLTKEEAIEDFWNFQTYLSFYKEITREVDAPAGNYKSVAKCSKSGVYLGPPNHHNYQVKLRELHKERFSRLPFEVFQRNIVVEQSEEAVNAWIEAEKTQTYYIPLSDLPKAPEKEESGEENAEAEAAEPAIDDALLIKTRAELEAHFLKNYFDQAYKRVQISWVPSAIPGKQISPALLTLLKETISEERRYPGKLASMMCRQLSGRNVAVYKSEKKLKAGPSRPHIIPPLSELSERPRQLMQWAFDNDGKGVEDLWKEILPETISDDDKAQWFHDLKWLLSQGYVSLHEDGKVTFSKKVAEQPKKEKKAPQAEQTEAPTEAKEKAPQDKAETAEAPADATAENAQDAPQAEQPEATPEAKEEAQPEEVQEEAAAPEEKAPEEATAPTEQAAEASEGEDSSEKSDSTPTE